MLIGERSGVITPTTPRESLPMRQPIAAVRDLAKLLGVARDSRVGVTPGQVADVLQALTRSGHARWHAGGRRLIDGEPRVFGSTSATALPPRSGVIVGDTGPWYVDAATGAVGRIRIQAPKVQPAAPSTARATGPGAASPARRRPEIAPTAEPVIVDRPHTRC